ncbi:amidase signature domain-containing protein [Fusarium flagelliforme]|uniref:amidase signature domain-containing protein n=1 Tax=Fusarium flagelliforme TaxID=2675880 RepID=UPI001E8D279F|nr:amidase signature domain-containing protein [Fusarium flagelliforme]KAH7174227.1 amidase signature domain-containing protein [Fusarium flagelliforme]
MTITTCTKVLENQQCFIDYPKAQQVPETTIKPRKLDNPVLRGPILVVVAFLINCIRFIREIVWHNAGFGSLRNIRESLEVYEARYDPAVIPLPSTSTQADIDSQQTITPPESVIEETLPETPYYSIADFRKLYLSGKATPTDVANALLPLIRRDINGKHSTAWISTRVDLVLKAAEESTIRYREGRPLGPLDGVPAAIKDDFDMDGYEMTMGSKNNYTGKGVSTGSITNWSARKLQDAGVIMLGKLNMHEFGMDTTGNNPIHGTPLNPFNPKYYTGGSSSGAAYAVAAGLIPIALAGDAGGSIRIPASYCSVFGLKPTHGRLSSFPTPNPAPTCCVQGPVSADMYSLATVYDIISDPHPTSRFPKIYREPSRGRKVLGIYEPWFDLAAPGVQAITRKMIRKLCTEFNYEVVPISIPHTEEGQIAHAMTVLADAASLLPESSNTTSANKLLLAMGRTTPAGDYVLAQKLRNLLMQHLAHLWQMHPGMMIITPTTACPGAPIKGGASELKYGLSNGDLTIESMTYVWLANFCGMPSLSVPAGYVVPEGQERVGEEADESTVGKIPVGLMVTGEWCTEKALLEFGVEAEAVLGEKRCRPPVWEDILEQAKKVAESNEK